MKKPTKHISASRILSGIISSLLIVSTQPVAAEGVDLGIMMVTATRTERDVSDIPASVTVITADEIKDSAAQSADEVIQGLAGVDGLHTIGILSTSTSNTISLRGLGGGSEARTLLLINGVPSNDLSVGAIEWNKIPLNDIERIEVVRGPASAIYGSNAMGGVINIITKAPSKETISQASIGYGSMNTRVGTASVSGSNGGLGFRLSGNVMHSDGYQDLTKALTKPTSIAQGVERENMSGNLNYQINNNSSIDLNASHFHEQKTGTLDYAGFNPYEQESNDLTGKYSLDLGEGRLFSAQLYGRWDESSYDSANYATGYTTTSYSSSGAEERFGGNLQYTMPFKLGAGADHILTSGIDFNDGQIKRHNEYLDGSNRQIRIRGSQRYMALYLQDEIFMVDDALIVNVGGRFDRWNNYDGYGYDDAATPIETDYEDSTLTAFNPKLSALYHLSDTTTLRGSIGKAFRAPTLNDLYSTFVWGSSVWAGNPNLGPETVVSYEIGLDQQFGNNADLSMTIYRNNAEDFIGFITPDPVGNPYYKEKQNIGAVSTQGIELDLKYRLSEWWSLSASATYNRSLVEEYAANSSIEGNYLPETPKHKATISLGYNNPAFLTGKMTMRYVGDRYSDDANTENKMYENYTVVDLHLAKGLSKTYSISLDVNDLFNEGYTEYYVSPGRTVMAKLSASF